jgi:hypothetical protein
VSERDAPDADVPARLEQRLAGVPKTNDVYVVAERRERIDLPRYAGVLRNVVLPDEANARHRDNLTEPSMKSQCPPRRGSPRQRLPRREED